MSYQTVKSVAKAMKILELLIPHSAENRALTLADVREETGILPATARNLLRTLEACGYVTHTARGKYEEGERCQSLLRTGGILRRLKEVSEPIIEETSRDLSESLLLVTIANGRRMELIRRQVADDQLQNPEGQANAKPYLMRTTRVFLAWFSPEQLDFFVKHNGLPPREHWPECNESMTGLQEALKEIRRRGGAMIIR